MSSRSLVVSGLCVVAAVAGAAGLPRRGSERDRDASPVTGGATGEALVTRVVDGDTAILSTLGRSRFIGVDTPEVFGHRDCFGPQASAFTKRTLTGLRVRYEIGAEPRDRYGRALVYLDLPDGRSFNEQLVARGYARPLPIAPNTRYAERFARLARAASSAGRGLWSVCPA
ncbi:MAG TPA: thermonuclease family protein [Solirubrobacteraceae bacterium]|jgi:micrococcal nuclease